MKLKEWFGRKAVIMPVSVGSAFIWLFVFSAWIGGTEHKEKPLKQEIAAQPKQEPVVEPEKQVKPELAKTEQPAPEMKQQAAPEMKQQASAPKAVPQYSRQTLEEEGEAYLGAGNTMENLPGVDGYADTLGEYLAFGRAARWKFMVYDTANRKYLGELVPGDSPAIVRVDLAALRAAYSAKGRLVGHSRLKEMCALAARNSGMDPGTIRLYFLVPDEFNAYIAGKLLRALKENGLEASDVLAVKARYVMRGNQPLAQLTSVRLARGEVNIKDVEI